MFWLNAVAVENMAKNTATLAVFHEPMFRLKAVASSNMFSIVVAEAVFHEPISPL
jgi:hypothetical protein